MNGAMATENADLLYAYGKCLHFLALQTSSVLGGDAAAAQLNSSKEKKPVKKEKLNGVNTNDQNNGTKLETIAGNRIILPEGQSNHVLRYNHDSFIFSIPV